MLKTVTEKSGWQPPDGSFELNGETAFTKETREAFNQVHEKRSLIMQEARRSWLNWCFPFLPNHENCAARLSQSRYEIILFVHAVALLPSLFASSSTWNRGKPIHTYRKRAMKTAHMSWIYMKIQAWIKEYIDYFKFSISIRNLGDKLKFYSVEAEALHTALVLKRKKTLSGPQISKHTQHTISMHLQAYLSSSQSTSHRTVSVTRTLRTGWKL